MMILNVKYANGKRTCPTCRAPHKANSILNLPINVALERVTGKREKNKKRSLDYDNEDGEDGGQCQVHKKSILYFYCETHLVMVCKECTVLEHPINQCKIIPIKEHIKKKENSRLFANVATMSLASMTHFLY